MKTFKDITVSEIESELRKLAAEQPDFVYAEDGGGCYYDKGSDWGTECDGCIFGQALQRLGISKSILGSFDGVIGSLPFEFQLPSYWGNIQSDQDLGTPWGEAIKHLEN